MLTLEETSAKKAMEDGKKPQTYNILHLAPDLLFNIMTSLADDLATGADDLANLTSASKTTRTDLFAQTVTRVLDARAAKLSTTHLPAYLYPRAPPLRTVEHLALLQGCLALGAPHREGCAVFFRHGCLLRPGSSEPRLVELASIARRHHRLAGFRVHLIASGEDGLRAPMLRLTHQLLLEHTGDATSHLAVSSWQSPDPVHGESVCQRAGWKSYQRRRVEIYFECESALYPPLPCYYWGVADCEPGVSWPASLVGVISDVDPW